MSVQTEIDRIISAVDAAHEKVISKGGTSARPYLVGNLEDAIGTIPDAKDPVLQTKTVSPTTAQQNVTPDSGYDGLSKVTVNAMPAATQATPSIEVSSGGLITAKSTQSAGYVAAGTKSATKQLTTQAAQTITPGTSNKTIASGRYLTGTQTIKGDANLKASNIKSGVSIFGVSGSVQEGENLDAVITEQDSLISQIQTALQGKAAGGGGAVETCTVRMEMAKMSAPTGSYFRVDYTNADMQHAYVNGLESITVVVGTIITFSMTSSMSTMSGNASEIFYSMNHAAYVISGDCTYTYEG